MIEVESPCINTCVIDQDSGFCRGCYRTLTEVSYWAVYSRADKLAVLASIAQRKSAVATSENQSAYRIDRS